MVTWCLCHAMNFCPVGHLLAKLCLVTNWPLNEWRHVLCTPKSATALLKFRLCREDAISWRTQVYLQCKSEDSQLQVIYVV